jgi:hypothetical protein
MAPADRQAAYRALEALYAELQSELDAIGPACRLTGRCCHLKEFGHQLWATRLEIEYLLERAGFPKGLPDGVCPYLEEEACGARPYRMLACRTFFCEASFRYHMGPLHERYHRRVRDLHRLAGWPYEYVEFLGELARRVGTPPGPA